jgi:hypothetical protein
MSKTVLSHLNFLQVIPFGTSDFQSATEDGIVTLEQTLGVQLPNELRLVLLHFGELTFDVEVIFTSKDASRYIIGWLYGLQSIVSTFHSPPDEFPPASIAIGEEGLGNYYCLGLRGRFEGQILYWDHEIGWGEAEPYVIQGLLIPDRVKTPCLKVLADSYGDFILGLRRSQV